MAHKYRLTIHNLRRRGGGGQSKRIDRLELSKEGFSQLKKYLFSIFFPEVVLHKCWCSAFIRIARNGAPGSHCVALDVQYGQGCLLERELSPEARLLTFKAQALTYSKSPVAFKRVNNVFKFEYVSRA